MSTPPSGETSGGIGPERESDTLGGAEKHTVGSSSGWGRSFTANTRHTSIDLERTRSAPSVSGGSVSEKAKSTLEPMEDDHQPARVAFTAENDGDKLNLNLKPYARRNYESQLYGGVDR